MPVKETRMSATRVPARTLRPGKEHARLVVAGITMLPGISNRVLGMLCSIKEEASRDIGKTMEIFPLQGRNISNLGSSNTSKISSMSSTSTTSQRSSKT
jgi:hypothetical protein